MIVYISRACNLDAFRDAVNIDYLEQTYFRNAEKQLSFLL